MPLMLTLESQTKRLENAVNPNEDFGVLKICIIDKNAALKLRG